MSKASEFRMFEMKFDFRHAEKVAGLNVNLFIWLWFPTK